MLKDRVNRYKQALLNKILASQLKEETMCAPRLKYFDYDHLPEYLQEISRPFKEIAEQVLQESDVDEFEIEVGLRKLLEAKDCFVRAHVRD